MVQLSAMMKKLGKQAKVVGQQQPRIAKIARMRGLLQSSFTQTKRMQRTLSLVLAAFLAVFAALSIRNHSIRGDEAMTNSEKVRRLSRIAACLLLVACTLAILASVGTAQAASTSMTFKSVGYSSATQSSFTLDFTSPYVEASGRLDLHFQAIHQCRLIVLINGAQVYMYQYYDIGVQWDHVNLPTGVIDQGVNTLQLEFENNGPATVFEDSLITLNEEAPATGITFESLGYSASTNSSFTENFTSPYAEVAGRLDLHFQAIYQCRLIVLINGAQVYMYQYYDIGVQCDHINLPTGVVDQGVNTLQLKFENNGPATVFEDSLVTLSRPPVAADDAYNTDVNTPLNISAPGVLSNDTDADGDTLTAILASTVSHGTLTLNADGSFSYTPSARFNGTDSFTYKASDGVAQSNAATVTIMVTEVPPSQPSNVSPVNGATDVSLTPTLGSSAFSDPDTGDTQAASQWQITTTSGSYTSPVFDSDVDTSNLTTNTIPSGRLSVSTIYYWHVRHQDSYGNWSDYSTETSFTTTSNQVPATPSNTAPASGATGVSGTPTLKGSAFFDHDAGDTHAASQWQITATSGSYTSPVFDSGVDTTNMTEIAVPSGKLSYNMPYYWHVKYQDSYGNWSAYSEETSFTTTAMQVPATPSNASPASGATGISLTPTLKGSAFSDPDAGDTHAASQWQITATSGSYTSPVFDSGVDTANKTEIAVPSGKLSYNTAYYWHVRYQDSYGNWSAYSAQTSFATVASGAPAKPSNVLPAKGATDISLKTTLRSSAFSDPDSGDTHAASQWQITTSAGDYSSTVFDSGRDVSNLIQLSVPSGVLNASTTYYWRVRHQDNHDNWSDYSTETSFTTGSDVNGSTTSNRSFLFYVIGGACGGVVLIGVPTGYLWRRRRFAALMKQYEENLKQWEDEGYDISDFKKKWL